MMCDQVTQAAEAQVERDPSLLERGALVLSHRSWPGGIIGIVAGRLAEKYHRPTILIAAPPGELARGSARSIEGCDISAAIAAHGDLLEGFGGHPMAAGLSIEPVKISEFRQVLSRSVRRRCGDVLSSEPMLEIDGYVPLTDLSLGFVQEVERLAPFGAGNPPLILATRGLSLIEHTTVGRTGEHMKLIVEDEEGTTQQVLWWRAEAADLPQGRFDLAYTVRASDFRGRRHVQVEWIDARPLAEPTTLRRSPQPAVHVVDYRYAPDPRNELEQLHSETQVTVWSEGQDTVSGLARNDLAPAESLAIWTTPPGGPELRAALGQVSPRVVYLFAVDPGLARPKSFLTHLARLAKRAIIEQGGTVDLSSLLTATAHREETVRAGLAWLEAKGHVVLLEGRDDVIRLAPGDGSASKALSGAAARLRALLEETAAYRAHVARADAESLINGALSD
jgi:single-stranded-DNA-specific exonuclease